MLISVIIPVYNVIPFLEEALDSVINQTYNNLEIIVVDDGSTDGSSRICDRYAERDERVIVVHQTNKGLSAARNVGLDRMSGDAVAFLDADDAYLPNYVKTMVDAMVNNKAVDLVVCKHTTHKTKSKMMQNGKEEIEPPIRQGYYNRINVLQSLIDGTLNHIVWNKLYKKKLWNNIRFPVGHVYEDIDTTYKIINKCNMVYVIDKPLYLYRKRSGSISSINSWENIYDGYLSWLHITRFVEENYPSIFSEAQLKKCQRTQFYTMISCYRSSSIMNGSKSSITVALRTKIIETKRKNMIDNCKYRFKIAYLLICFCPRALNIAYSIYYYIKRSVK